MEIFNAILEHIVIGGTIVFLVDLFALITKVPNPITNQERVFLIAIWPITLFMFIYTVFKNLKR